MLNPIILNRLHRLKLNQPFSSHFSLKMDDLYEGGVDNEDDSIIEPEVPNVTEEPPIVTPAPDAAGSKATGGLSPKQIILTVQAIVVIVVILIIIIVFLCKPKRRKMIRRMKIPITRPWNKFA